MGCAVSSYPSDPGAKQTGWGKGELPLSLVARDALAGPRKALELGWILQNYSIMRPGAGCLEPCTGGRPPMGEDGPVPDSSLKLRAVPSEGCSCCEWCCCPIVHGMMLGSEELMWAEHRNTHSTTVPQHLSLQILFFKKQLLVHFHHAFQDVWQFHKFNCLFVC